MMQKARPEIYPEGPEKQLSTTLGQNELAGETIYELEAIETSKSNPKLIGNSVGTHERDPLRICAIFISAGDRIKSMQKLKLNSFFHIKKKDEDSKFEKNLRYKRNTFNRKKF